MLYHKILSLLIIIVAVTFATACQSFPVPTTKVESTLAPTTIASFPKSIATPTAPAVVTSTAVAAAAEEEDCMGECHIPDPNDSIAAGAMPQPPTHIGRTTCLSCHSTLTDPILPATHVGRLDPSCTVCHKEDSAAK